MLCRLDPTDHQRADHPAGLGRGDRAGCSLIELRALATQEGGDGTGEGVCWEFVEAIALSIPIDAQPKTNLRRAA